MKIYFDHELKAEENRRYRSAFLDGALVTALLLLLATLAIAYGKPWVLEWWGKRAEGRVEYSLPAPRLTATTEF